MAGSCMSAVMGGLDEVRDDDDDAEDAEGPKQKINSEIASRTT